jgi:hypothetical protein
MTYKIGDREFEVNLKKVDKYLIYGYTPEFQLVQYFSLEFLFNSNSIVGYIEFKDDSYNYPESTQTLFYNFEGKLFDDFLIWNNWKIKKRFHVTMKGILKSVDTDYQIVCPKGQTDYFDLFSTYSNYRKDLLESFPGLGFQELKFLQIASQYSSLLDFKIAISAVNYRVSQLVDDGLPFSRAQTPKLNLNPQILNENLVALKLHSLIGLSEVKSEVEALCQQVEIRKRKIDKGILVTPSTLP